MARSGCIKLNTANAFSRSVPRSGACAGAAKLLVDLIPVASRRRAPDVFVERLVPPSPWQGSINGLTMYVREADFALASGNG
jgi:hypothetical protein